MPSTRPARCAGRAAAVTGAGSGLGRETARRLATEGARVALLDVNEEALESLAKELAAAGQQATAYPCDVSDPDAVEGAFAALVAEAGRLDVLCNVAGIGLFSRTTELTYEAWCRVLAVNLTGPFLTCRAALAHLERTGGNIVNVASDAGAMGLPYAAPYSASKGGLVLFSKSLATEVIGRGVRVNVVSPGGMHTDMLSTWVFPADEPFDMLRRFSTPLGTADPAEVASVIAFVASDEAKRMTGAVVPVDGGSTA
jgi:NAD(P)-dependent dehydrogenase (short-subunit alcohol dehydrogenase family)